LADLLDILAADVNAKAIEVAGLGPRLVRLKGKAEFRSRGQTLGRTHPAPLRRVCKLTAAECRRLNRGDLVRPGGRVGSSNSGRRTFW